MFVCGHAVAGAKIGSDMGEVVRCWMLVCKSIGICASNQLAAHILLCLIFQLYKQRANISVGLIGCGGCVALQIKEMHSGTTQLKTTGTDG